MSESLKIPRLRRWKARGLAYCNFKGRRYYFGKWGEPETERRFLAFVQKITAPASVSPTVRSDDPTLAEVVLSFFEARRHYYQKDGRSTRQLERFRAACEYPLAMFADLPVRLLGPRRLLEARDAMEASGRFSRSYINTLISCFRGVIRYGVEAELVRPDVLVALQAVAPLKRGRSSAREVEPIKPVTAETVEATLAELAPRVISGESRSGRGLRRSSALIYSTEGLTIICSRPPKRSLSIESSDVAAVRRQTHRAHRRVDARLPRVRDSRLATIKTPIGERFRERRSGPGSRHGRRTS